MTLRPITCLAVIAIAASSGAARAQTAPAVAIAPNAETRATVATGPERRISGQFVRLTPDTLVLRRRRAVTIALPLVQVQRLEVRGGREPWRGARWGAGIVGGIAVVFGGIDVARGNLEAGEYAGTILGNAVIGGLIGYAIAPRGWVEVPRQAVDAGANRR